MSRVTFNNQPVAPAIDTGRADVACFVGLVRRVPGAVVSNAVAGWLQGLGFTAGQIGALNVPLPIESYGSFTALFMDGTAGDGFGTDYVAAAVRSFFSQGGKRCYVVRVDDPLTPQDSVINPNPSLQLSGNGNVLSGSITIDGQSVSGATGNALATAIGNNAVLQAAGISASFDPILHAVVVTDGATTGAAPIIGTNTLQDAVLGAVTLMPLLSGKMTKLGEVLLNPMYSVSDATTWTGLGALAALEEVSYVATPDLPALCASEPVGALGQLPVIPTGVQEFTACVQATMVPQQRWTYGSDAPRLAAADYETWAQSVAVVLNYLSGGAQTHQLHLREMQYVAAFPMPQDLDVASAAENPSAAEIAQDIHGMIDLYLRETVEPGVVQDWDNVPSLTLGQAYPWLNGTAPGEVNLSSSFLQLAYPWLKTSASGALLEQLQPPDGPLAGLLARNALLRGAFTSATKITPSEIYDVQPALPAQEMKSSATALEWGPLSPQKALIERLSLFGFSPAGIGLLSDVTAYPRQSYRAGAVNRLVNVICRAARTIGETAVFESNGPALWGQMQRGLQNLMTQAWALGALDGTSPSDAFSVRCDRSTMTQNDLDNGRMIALVTFTAAMLVETITVTLAMEASGTSVQAIAAGAAGSAGIASGAVNAVGVS